MKLCEKTCPFVIIYQIKVMLTLMFVIYDLVENSMNLSVTFLILSSIKEISGLKVSLFLSFQYLLIKSVQISKYGFFIAGYLNLDIFFFLLTL